VRCHVCGTSIQPGGLSTAMTVRSSYKIRIGLQSGSSMELGLAIRAMVAAGVNRLKLFGKNGPAVHKSEPAVAKGEPAFSKSEPAVVKGGPAYAKSRPAFAEGGLAVANS